jgi:oxygen-independent coproporphyrinogen III oxidase
MGMIPQSSLVIDAGLLRRYDQSGPRYTSYPTADRFVEAFDAAAYRRQLEHRDLGGVARGLSLYVHVPFCSNICFYCGCNKVITRDHGRSAKYLRYLAKEAALVAEAVAGNRQLCQFHIGGGTPTFLAPEELRRLMDILAAHFVFASDGEYSIEIDPRSVAPGTVGMLAQLGFNRMSVGVQDFDPAVQKAVNRIQDEALTRATVAEGRAAGFKSINLDLIYGLPKQNVIAFSHTIDRVIDIDPDRIALYGYAHLPHVFKPQRRIAEADLPDAETRIDMMLLAIRRLTAAGYVYIGMDHFAKPADELAVAQRQGRLHRNFQGYSTHAECDLVALGVTAIGAVGPTYVQNRRTLDEYYDHLDAGLLPVLRGIELSADDLLRRALIQSLMCHGAVSIESLEISHLIEFERYFAEELMDLQTFIEDGLVELDDEWLTVTPRGRLLVRAVCMVFDRYLRTQRRAATYSKVI